MITARIAISAQLCALGIFVVLVNVYNNNTRADAHSFSPNSLSTFISLAYEADVELSLANSNFPSNITLALYHGKNAVELLDDAYRLDDEIIDDTDFVRKYNEGQNSKNATIQALVIANIVDQILREYGEAFGIHYDLTNMSNMNMIMQNMSNSDLPISSSLSCSSNELIHSDIEGEKNNNSYTDIINFDNYQSAQKLSESVIQIFNNKLCPLAESTNNANKTAIIMIHDRLIDLKYLLNNKASAQDVMVLVHGNLHPGLQAAYNLKLKQ